MSFGFRIIVKGNYACFTRPEMKVERVSYDVPTPGALEGMLKSVYWKPAIKYVIDKIIVFNSIEFLNVRRNEVKEKLLLSNLKKSMRGERVDLSIYTDVSRNQRASMILKKVCYGIEFHFELTKVKNDKEQNSENKHYNIIKRRLINGQYFRVPCLGCSEFPVTSIMLLDGFDLNLISDSILKAGDVDLGYMSYKVVFDDKGIPINNNWENPVFSDCASTIYYRPHMINGIIDVQKYREGLKC